MYASFAASAWMQDMAKSRPLDIQGQRSFKVLVLNEVDRLSKDAQHSLRRTMEKYSSACRLVLLCNNVSKVPLGTPAPCQTCQGRCLPRSQSRMATSLYT